MNFKSTFLYGFCFMLCESNNIATYASSMPASFSDTVTISNPMLWDDVPDPDIIRVGCDFYMVSTTMHLMPGAPIMKSHDLKHWKTIGYIFNRLTDSPKYNMIKGTVYGRGQWATSLKYHNGKLINNMVIDWNATLKLWYEDKDAEKKKKLIKIPAKEIFIILY